MINISLNGPLVNSNQCDQVIQRVVEEYIKQRHIKLPQPVRVPASKYSCTTSTQTLKSPIDTIGKGNSKESNVFGRINAEVNRNYIQTYFEDESESDEEDSDRLRIGVEYCLIL